MSSTVEVKEGMDCDKRLPRKSSASPLDVQCPICLSILIEPVTMPCQHELCMPCFKESVDKVKICCPLCRMRISSWTRKATKQRQLVNQVRWAQVKKAFPELVERRLKGLDVCLDQEVMNESSRIISKCGEIRKEYEIEMKKQLEQKMENERINERRFWDFMKQDVDDNKEKRSTISRVKEARPNSICDKIKNQKDSLDPDLPTDLSIASKSTDHEISSAPVIEILRATSSRSTSNSINTRSESATSTDSISQEFCHFKPIKSAAKTPPKPQPDGRLIDPPLVLAKPRNLRDFPAVASTSFIETCVPLRRKLTTIDAERVSKQPKKKEANKKFSPSSCVPSDDSDTTIDVSPNLLICEDPVPKPILPLEPNIPISHQTSTYSPSSSSFSIGRVEEKSHPAKNEVVKGGKDSGKAELSEKTTTSPPRIQTCSSPIIGCGERIAEKEKGTKKSDEKKCKVVVVAEQDAKIAHNRGFAPSTSDQTVAQIMEQQIALMNKLKQEEADWKLAQKLQRNFDLEWRSCRGVRREPYLLRKRHISAVPLVNGGQRRKHV